MYVSGKNAVLLVLLVALLLLLCLFRPRERVAVETFADGTPFREQPQSLYAWFSENR